MKGVSLQLKVATATPSATTTTDTPTPFPFRSGTDTLQINSVVIRGVPIPNNKKTVNASPNAKKETEDNSAKKKESYLPHWKLRQLQRRVVTLHAHIEGPEGNGEETVVPIAAVNLRPKTSPSGSSEVVATVSEAVSATLKVDLRFQMEKVRFSLNVRETGDLREDAGMNVEATLLGTVSSIQ